MVKEEIRIKKAIVHILDSTIGMPVLSDAELDFGSEFADFLTGKAVNFIKKSRRSTGC